MSCDASLLKLPNEVQLLEQIPEDYSGACIGARSFVAGTVCPPRFQG